ncbi:MAG: 50S ribosomal protein L9 [Spirochaetales bacterium]|nr:50S ribosomal protein L9 [Spirochaetales bacterium]
MKVILNEDVYNLGEEGDVCNVKRGYARNYLIPKQLAFPYTKQNIAVFNSKKEKIEKKKEEKRQTAKSMKEKIEGLEVVIKMPAGDTGKLFGAVTSLTVAEELAKTGISIERKKIELPVHSLKMTGNYNCKVRLYENEAAQLKLVIEKSEEEKKEKKDEGKKTGGRGRRERTVQAEEVDASAEDAVADAGSENDNAVSEPVEAVETAEATADTAEAAETEGEDSDEAAEEDEVAAEDDSDSTDSDETDSESEDK